MKITAKLAYSQLKINRSRTLWTLLTIALSTALMTAVCSFAASGNAMLINFLGEDYGEYGQSYQTLLLIPAIIFGILIVAMSVTVVSNIFRISAQERVTQFGILKCTGATHKQIMDTVMYESIQLCAVGIPAGIILGILLALGGIRVANHYIDDLNDLAHIMIREINLSLSFVFSWKALLLAAAICFVTVLVSAWFPAYRASKVSAIDCIRGAKEVKVDRKHVHTSTFVQRLFGFEGTLAARNLKRSRCSFRATLISLSVGVILFIGLGELGNQASAIENYMFPGTNQTVVAEYSSSYTEEVNPTTGRNEIKYSNPIDSKDGNRIARKLEKFGGTDIVGVGNDWDTYDTVLPRELVSEQMRQALEKEGELDDEFPVEIIVMDARSYEKLCKKAGVPEGSTILLNHYSYNDFGHEVHLKPFLPSLKEIKLRKADGSTLQVSVQGFLTQQEIPEELFYPNTNPVRLVVPQAVVRSYTWHGLPADVEGFIDYSNQVLAEEFPSRTDASYMEEGFDTRVYKFEDYVKVMNIAISLAAVFMYSFVILLLLIGLTNVISTLSTNVLMRSREFAVLKSVGMTPEGLKHMLNYESVLCSVKALMYGIPIGIIISILINLPIRMMFPIPYQLPWLEILMCILSVFLITWSTTRYAVYKLKNQNIVETIRSESGR